MLLLLLGLLACLFVGINVRFLFVASCKNEVFLIDQIFFMSEFPPARNTLCLSWLEV